MPYVSFPLSGPFGNELPLEELRRKFSALDSRQEVEAQFAENCWTPENNGCTYMITYIYIYLDIYTYEKSTGCLGFLGDCTIQFCGYF